MTVSIRNNLLELILDALEGSGGVNPNGYVVSGRGGIGVDSQTVVGTINATPKLIDGFDTEIITDTKNITQLPLSNNGLAFDVQGVWDLSIKVSLEFDEVNNGRKIKLRFYNSTAAIDGAVDFVYFVGRNTGGANLTVTIPVEVGSAVIGDVYQIRVLSDTDTFSNAVNIGTTFTAVHVSENLS